MEISFDELGPRLKADEKARMAGLIRTIRVTAKTTAPAIVQGCVDSTQPHIPVDRGTYRRSWQVGNIDGGAVVYNSAPYAAIIEHGRRPGKFPPIRAIEEWVARKGFVQAAAGFKMGVTAFRRAAGYEEGKTSARSQNNAAVIRQAAFLIARKIAREGMAARHVLARAEPRITAAVRNAIDLFMRNPLPESKSGGQHGGE
jgi:hypothetical protein